MAATPEELEAAKKILDDYNDSLDETREKVQKIIEKTESYKNILEEISNLQKSKNDIEEELIDFANQKSSLMNLERSKQLELLKGYVEYRDVGEEINKNNKEINVLKQSQAVIDQQRLLMLQNENKELKRIHKAKKESLEREGLETSEVSHHYEKLKGKFQEKSDIQGKINDKQKESNALIEKGTAAYRKQEKVVSRIYDRISRTAKAVLKSTEYWQKQDSAVSKLAATFALNNEQVSKYRENLLRISKDTERLYGVSAEALTKIQQGYAESTGRAIKLSESQFKDAAALQKVMGEGESTQYLADAERLGLATEDASDKIAQIMNLSAKQGVTASKASKTFAQNLKLAENYTFKDGVDGLAKMTVYSQQMRVNMENIAQLADKISTPEGAIDAAAKLQVLGGQFAQLANPLSMMYEGLNDLEGLTERVVKMSAGKGVFNTKTGQVDIGSMDKTFLKRAGEALGISGNEMIQMAQAQVKRNAISQQINRGVTDEDFKNLIQTTAQYNKKKGRFEITDNAGNTVDVASLSDKDASKFSFPKTQEQDIHDIAMNTQGMAKHLKNIENGMKAAYASGMDDMFGGAKNLVRDNLVGSNKNTPWLASAAQTVGGFGRVGLDIAGAYLGGSLIKEGGKWLIGKLTKGGTPGDAAKNIGNKTSNIGKGIGRFFNGKKLKGKVGWAALAAGALLTLTSGKSSEDEQYNKVNDDVRKKSDDVTDILSDSNNTLHKISDTLSGGNFSNSATPNSSQTLVGKGLDVIGGAANGLVVGSSLLTKGGKNIVNKGLEKVAGKSVAKAGTKIIGKAGAGPFGAIGMGVDALRLAGNATGLIDEGSFVDKAMGVGSWAATGAGIGSIFGPIGTGIGAAAGALYGLYDENKEAVNEFLSDAWTGVKNFGKGMWNIATAPFKAVAKIGSDEMNDGSQVIAMIGKNVEYIASAMGSTPVYPSVKVKNFDSNFKKVSSGQKITDVSSKMKDISIKPIQLELSGTIKLDAGTSGKIDLKSLTKDPSFVRELTKLISTQINANNNGGRANNSRNVPGTKLDALA